MAVAPANPTQITPPRVALIDDRTGAISREWYRFFLSLRSATEVTQQEASLVADSNSLLASYSQMLEEIAHEQNAAPDSNTFTASLASQFYTFQNDVLVAPPSLFGTVTSVGASGGTTGLTFTGSPITTSGTFTLGGTLGIANGGTNSTGTPTAGGVAYGTGTAIVVNAAGPAGYVLTSGGAAPPVWTPVASLAVGTEAYWGSFWDTTTQTAATINTAYALTLNTADVENNGVTIVSGSRVTFIHAGVYSLTFSAQLTNTDNSNTAHIVNIWLRKNGTDVIATDSKFTVPGKFGSAQGALIGTVNFVLPLAANDYIELVWSTNDTSVAITSFPAGTTPVTPVVPSIIFTAVAAAPVGLGYAGVVSVTSLTISTGSKVLTVNTNATDTAFIVGNRVRLVNSAVNYMDGVITAYSGTSMTVLVDGIAGSGTYTSWAVTLTGSVGGVTSFSGNSTGLTPATATTGAISLAGTLNVANGGTGQTTYTNGQLLIGNTTGNTLAKATLTAGTNVSITNGAGAITINATDAFVGTVTSVGGTGTVNGITLTGTVTTTGSLTLGGTLSGVSLTTQVSGVLPAVNGGTGQSVYAVGDLLYASTTTALSKLADVATGNALISGGVGVAPLYGKIGLTTHVTGTLPVTNGGTGVATLSSGYLIKGNNGSPVLTSVIYDTGTNVGIGNTAPGAKLEVTGDILATWAAASTKFIGSKFSTSYELGMYMDSDNRTLTMSAKGADGLGTIVFKTGATPTERARIDNNGNVGIGATANASAILDVQSTTKGVRMPNMTTTQKNAITSPAAGLMVFDTTLAKLCVYSGAAWQTVTST